MTKKTKAQQEWAEVATEWMRKQVHSERRKKAVAAMRAVMAAGVAGMEQAAAA